MKLRTGLLAALALAAFTQISKAQEPTMGPVMMPAHFVMPPWSDRARYRHRYRSFTWYPLPLPLACEAVLFPRSTLCAGRPATLGPYSYNPRVYY
jgi:hypothetical protein